MASPYEPRFKELMGVAAQELEWHIQAACRDHDPGLWFPRIGESYRRIQLAVSICEGCPVKKECLRYSISTNQKFGIWGGKAREERKALKKKMDKAAGRVK